MNLQPLNKILKTSFKNLLKNIQKQAPLLRRRVLYGLKK